MNIRDQKEQGVRDKVAICNQHIKDWLQDKKYKNI